MLENLKKDTHKSTTATSSFRAGNSDIWVRSLSLARPPCTSLRSGRARRGGNGRWGTGKGKRKWVGRVTRRKGAAACCLHGAVVLFDGQHARMGVSEARTFQFWPEEDHTSKHSVHKNGDRVKEAWACPSQPAPDTCAAVHTCPCSGPPLRRPLPPQLAFCTASVRDLPPYADACHSVTHTGGQPSGGASPQPPPALQGATHSRMAM